MTWQKRLFDLALALVLVLPVGLLIAILVPALYLMQGRPIFHGSERMRTPSRAFALWKFRTMRPAAGDSGVSGGDKAGRITPAGRILRRTRLDELPQLLNILAGDMSFVGPRPPLRQYVEAFPAVYAEVLKARPGVTGLATLIHRRHEERLLSQCRTPADTDAVYRRRCIPAKAKLDIIYRRNRSACWDAVILVRTACSIRRN